MAEAILPIIMVGTSLLTAGAQLEAGDQAEREANVEAKGEELRAVQGEADRKNRLARSLASSIAGFGAKGVKAFSGSPLAILQEDIEVEKVATERDKFNKSMNANSIRARGKSAKAGAKVSSFGTISSGLLGAAKVWPSAGGGDGSGKISGPQFATGARPGGK